MRIQTLAALPALALLVACGGGETTTTLPSGPPGSPGSNTSPPPVGPTVGPDTVKLDNRNVSYIASTDRILIQGFENFTIGRNNSSIQNSAIQNLPAGLVAYAGTGNRNKALRAVTPSGGGTALSVIGAFQAEDDFGIRIHREHARLTDTVLPTGTATYTGTYLGTMSRNQTNGSPLAGAYLLVNDEYIRGNVQLDADFANGSIDGTLSGRTSNKGRLFEDVQLGSTLIDRTGKFSGGVSGGELTTFRDVAETRDDGQFPDLGYSGLIAGPDGTEAVGNVAFNHFRDGAGFVAREVGVFVATSP